MEFQTPPIAELIICNNVHSRRGNYIAPAQDVEWVRISGSRRIAYGVGALLLLLIFLTIFLLAIQVGEAGFLEYTIGGATLAGGGFAAYCAITGKEQQKIQRK